MSWGHADVETVIGADRARTLGVVTDAATAAGKGFTQLFQTWTALLIPLPRSFDSDERVVAGDGERTQSGGRMPVKKLEHQCLVGPVGRQSPQPLLRQLSRPAGASPAPEWAMQALDKVDDIVTKVRA